MKPIDKAAVEGAAAFGVLPDELGEEHWDFARAVFASIDTDELARAIADAVSPSGGGFHDIAEAVKAHLLKEST